MRKVITGFAGAFALFSAFAASAAGEASPPAVAIPVPSAVTPASAPPPPADVPPEAPAAIDPPQPVTATLNDDSRVEFDPDSSVWVIGTDGKRNPAPDGTLTLKDGTPFSVKDGKRVDE